jgi:hypothetical protein
MDSIDRLLQRVDADELLDRYVLRKYRADPAVTGHLSDCPDTVVESHGGTDGAYGCDTGCDYVRFDAVLSCPHGPTDTYEFGDFGQMWLIIHDMAADAGTL